MIDAVIFRVLPGNDGFFAGWGTRSADDWHSPSNFIEDHGHQPAAFLVGKKVVFAGDAGEDDTVCSGVESEANNTSQCARIYWVVIRK